MQRISKELTEEFIIGNQIFVRRENAIFAFNQTNSRVVWNVKNDETDRLNKLEPKRELELENEYQNLNSK